jgi:ParB family transcriptional regulator, chromosome partitioning protein
LDPLEEADGYRQLQDLGMTQAAIAAAVHRSQPAIANTIRLLKLPKAVQDLVQAGKLTPSHGVALLRYESVP